MSTTYRGLDKAVQDHLRRILDSSGLPAGEDSLETLARGWLEKEKAFDDQAASLGMETAAESKDAGRGFLALTYSGSLVAVGPVAGGKRRAVYVSIDMRRDVPSRAESDNAVLSGNVAVGREIVFEQGPVQKSSAIYRLALLPAALALTDQNEKLDEATLALTREFRAVDETGIDELG